jgi:hypothetical protein
MNLDASLVEEKTLKFSIIKKDMSVLHAKDSFRLLTEFLLLFKVHPTITSLLFTKRSNWVEKQTEGMSRYLWISIT